MSASRLPTGGRIDRSRPIGFTFDGQPYSGFAGDTLASALLATGVGVVSHGIGTNRPRGIMAAGVEEPNALVQVQWPNGVAEPMLRATQVEIVNGLQAHGVRARGALSPASADGRFDKRFCHCDVLVVGAGPAGIAAALAAGRTGARVILVDEGSEAGGTLLGTSDRIDGGSALDWLSSSIAALAGMTEVRVLTRATALAYHDHQFVLVAQRQPTPATEGRLWHVRAREVVLATGAHERPIVFADNDRPGIMLASAVRTYLHRYAVRPGGRAVVFTTTDAGLSAARDLEEAGVEIVDVVDARHGRVVAGTVGTGRLEAVIVGDRTLACDLLAVSGGWNPVLHLFSQSGGSTRYEPRLAAYVPDRPAQRTQVAGALTGTWDLGDCVREGSMAGARAAFGAGFEDSRPIPQPGLPIAPIAGSGSRAARDRNTDDAACAVWVVPGQADTWDTHFVDLERDVTVRDLQAAVGAGLQSIEHVKRFTTVGTASDQGKTSWAHTSSLVATLLGAPDGSLGMPRFRAPYTSVSFALLAGRDRGVLHDPIRVTAVQEWHAAQGAVFENVGQWKRPRYYPSRGESMDEAVVRECTAARTGVAVTDASTLGKIDLQGPDVGELLNRLYTNAFAKLAVGSCRYGVMCRLDGMMFDDGVTSRLADDRFHMTTTTGNAAPVMEWIEEWLQTEWPALRVKATSVTEQWATIAVVGPRSRDVLRRLAPSLDVEAKAFPFMTWRDADVAGLAARVFRISFSGELAYEINVPTWHGRTMWEAVMAAGRPLGITPYGTEALHVLRAEKGYPIIGQETDGTVTPQDLGMEWIVAKTKPFIGSRSQRRPEIARPDRKQLVALLPRDPQERLPEGAQLVEDPQEPRPMRMIGHVTSSYYSAALGRTFALALVRGGRSRIGDTIHAPLPDRTIDAVIAHPVLHDPENRRRDG